MKVSKELFALIEATKIKIVRLGETPVKPESWEMDDDGLMYLCSLTEQFEGIETK